FSLLSSVPTFPSSPTRRSSDLHGHLLVAEKDDVARVREDGGNVGRHEELVVAETDHDRRTVAHRDDLLRVVGRHQDQREQAAHVDRKSTRLNSSHEWISYAVFC